MKPVAEAIDDLDDKQAIYQAKLLVQAAVEATPAFATMSDEEIAAAITKTVMAAVPARVAETTARLASPEPLPAGDAGEAIRSFLRVFAEAPGGSEVLDASLAMSDTSADFGLITGPVLCAFAWLVISGDVELTIGGVRYRKKGLTGKQQADLLQKIVPTVIKHFFKTDAY